ncbi:MAG TPA: cellulase family glycosylhydrolase [Terracidiphilus sp.]|nr:cellulase family glycosylhydrolase [Terracidiphilus sp.]
MLSLPSRRPPVIALHLVLTLVFLVSARLGLAQGAGYWHTNGAQILDSNGAAVRIAGINWYGFETTDMVAHGLNVQDYKTILQTIKSNGYNTVRIPFSNQMVESPVVPTYIAYSNSAGPINTDLQGLNSLQILDAIISQAGSLGLRVILDNHRSEAGSGAEANGLWYTSAYPESAWINDWVTLATRYQNNSTVIGMDLRDEPHNANSGGSCWSCGVSTQDWHLAAERAGNAILAVNSNLLIFVEGTDAIGSDTTFWGEQLAGVASDPVTLSVSNQLVYSPHDYGPAESSQPWFNTSTTSSSLDSFWNAHWGYISTQGLAPVWLGEFGTPNADIDVTDTTPGSQGQWFSSLVGYLTTNSNISWTYWALDGEDQYGLLDTNYDSTPADTLKQQQLASIQFALSTNNTITFAQISPQTYGAAPLTLSAASNSGLPITFAVVTGPASIKGNQLTITGAGTVTVSAQQAASDGYAAASASQSFVVNPAPLTVAVQNVTRYTNTPNPAFTSTVTGLVNGDLASSLNISYSTNATTSSPAGTYPITATVASTPNYNVTVTPGILTVTTAPATITWANPAAIVYGTPLGSQQLDATSTPALTLTYSPPAGSILNAGNQTLTVSGLNSSFTTPVTASVTIVVQMAPTTTIVSAPATVTSPYTVTATVTSAQGGTVTGPVNFFDEGVLIGSGMLDSKGTATFVIPTLASGAHSFTATYPGDANNLQSTSQAVYIGGTGGGDFSLAVLPTSLALAAGQPGSVSLSLSPTGGISGSASFTCAGLPTGSTCTFSPASLTLNGTATVQTTTVTITLPSTSASIRTNLRVFYGLVPGFLLAGLCIRRNRRMLRLLCLFMAAALCSGVLGCTVNSNVAPGGSTIQGSYNALVTVTSGTVAHTATIQVGFLQ